MQTDNFLIFTISGGAGKNVLATAVAKAIKKANPEMNIIVLTHFKDVWLFNPNVYRVYSVGQAPYFYANYVEGKKNVKIIAEDPYISSDHILGKNHLIETWCRIAGVPFNLEKPELFFNQREVEFAKKYYLDGRKILLIQTNGGAQTDIKKSWMRDLPIEIAQEVVSHFKNDYRIIQIRRQDQPALFNTEMFSGGLREMFSLIRFSDKRLFIDSVSQHASAAVGKSATVTWVRNKPEIFGYAMHDNIVTSAKDELDTTSLSSALDKFDITGNIYQCPFKEGTKLFDTEEIINSIKNQKN